MLLADVIAMWLWWLIISAIVTDGIVTFLLLWLMETTWEIIDNVVTVTDGKSHVNGWSYCHSGRWNYHILYRLMLCHAADGRATCVTAILLLTVADGIAMYLNGWCCCHNGRWNCHVGWSISRQMSLPLWEMV